MKLDELYFGTFLSSWHYISNLHNFSHPIFPRTILAWHPSVDLYILWKYGGSSMYNVWRRHGTNIYSSLVFSFLGLLGRKDSQLVPLVYLLLMNAKNCTKYNCIVNSFWTLWEIPIMTIAFAGLSKDLSRVRFPSCSIQY